MLSTSKALFRKAGGGASPTTDATFGYVPLLLETGSASSLNTTVTDSSASPNTVTRVSNQSTGWVSPYQTDGYWGNYLSASNYISTAASASLASNTSSFTLEFWYNSTATGNGRSAGNCSGPFGANNWVCASNNTAGKLEFFVYNYNPSVPMFSSSSSTVASDGSWHHIVLVRSTNTWAMFIDGIRQGSSITSSVSFNGTSSPLLIGFSGASPETAISFIGYISNFRFVNGSAQYDPTQTTITVPTSPLASVTNTQILTCYSNRFIDANTATTAKTITLTGTPQVTPYFYPSGFTAPAASPGAILLNGTSQYLTASSPNLSGSWTIEMWVYWTTGGTQTTFVSFNNGAGSGINFWKNTSNQLVVDDGTTGQAAFSTVTPVINAWNHIALVRNVTTTSAYVNGVLAGSNSFTPSTISTISIGRFNASTFFYFPGYISNLRVVNGTAVYTGNFTPPTLAFLQTSGAASASSYPSTTNVNTSFAASNTSLLLNFADGNYNSATNGVQNNTFIDTGPYAFPITRNGTPTQGSITPYWPNGQWSNYFNGSSSLNLATNAIPASGAFTFETFVYVTGTAASQVIAAQYPNGIASGRFQILWNDTANKFTVTIAASDIFVSDATYSANNWLYLVVQRDASNVWSMYVNGTRNTATVTSATAIDTAVTYIGNRNTGGGGYTGYISNLRVVTSALYSGSTITVPTTPFSVSTTNQVLLTCYSNRFIDANTATTAKAITVNSTPTVQAFQPFSPTASYTTALYGGSGYFNGSTDSLTAPASAALTLTANFTIEFWAYSGAFASGASNPTFISTSSGFIFYESSGSNRGLCLFVGSAIITTATTVLPNNQWNHVVCVRSGSTVSMFVNGSRVGTNASFSSTLDFSGAFINKYFADASGFFNGYTSNFRIVKGTAVYDPTLTTLTVPTAPVTAITNTSLLLNMTNAGIYDAAVQNDVTTVGDAQVSTTQSKWSPTSMKFDGTGDWLTAIDSTQLQLGTGDFTIEGWVYLSAISVAYGIISKGTATTGWSVNVTVLNKLQFSYTASVLTGSTSLATGTWYYFAVVRSGSATGNLKLYLNGSLEATSGGAVTDNFNQTSILYVGADRIGTSALNGYLQDIRITKGVGRTITASPTAAFPTK